MGVGACDSSCPRRSPCSSGPRASCASCSPGCRTSGPGATEGPDTWSPFDVVGHLIHGERTDWLVRVEIIVREGDAREFPPFDRTAMFEASRGRTLEELLDTFATLAPRTCSGYGRWTWATTTFTAAGATPSSAPVTLEQHLATWVAHDLSHIGQIVRVMGRAYTDAVGPWRAFLPMLETAERRSVAAGDRASATEGPRRFGIFSTDPAASPGGARFRRRSSHATARRLARARSRWLRARSRQRRRRPRRESSRSAGWPAAGRGRPARAWSKSSGCALAAASCSAPAGR